MEEGDFSRAAGTTAALVTPPPAPADHLGLRLLGGGALRRPAALPALPPCCLNAHGAACGPLTAMVAEVLSAPPFAAWRPRTVPSGLQGRSLACLYFFKLLY